jgi:hypothetical protein
MFGVLSIFPLLTHFYNHKQALQTFCVNHMSTSVAVSGTSRSSSVTRSELRRGLVLEAMLMLSKAASASIITQTRAKPDLAGLSSQFLSKVQL